jgi:3-hydroxybutyryl-CoA dehydrogenase
VVEASPENMALKRRLFTELEALVSPDTIMASNSSGMSVGDMTGHLAHQERVVGSHFFLPAQVIPLVEVSRGPRTSDETMERTIELWRSCGKRPIRIEKDVNGYVANRLQAALVREATNLVSEGVASAEDIDLAVQTSFGLRFMVSGPLEQRDLGGLDLHVVLARGLWPHLSKSDGPFPNVVDMVERGDLGLKSGQGFFDWSGRDPEDVRRQRTTQMIEVMSRLEMWPGSPGGRA